MTPTCYQFRAAWLKGQSLAHCHHHKESMKVTKLRVFAYAPTVLPVPIDKFHHDNTCGILSVKLVRYWSSNWPRETSWETKPTPNNVHPSWSPSQNSQWRLLTIFTIILHFLNWPTLKSMQMAAISIINNSLRPKTWKQNARQIQIREGWIFYFNIKNSEEQTLVASCFSGRRASFQARVLHRDALSSLYNLLKMHVHIFTCKLETTKPWKAKLLWPPSFLATPKS